MSNRKFTVIELLVVISIISVLVALTLSSFEKASVMTKRVVCLNNLKNIEVCTELYRKDNKTIPCPADWMVDFSPLLKYSGEGTALNIYNCPGDTDGISVKVPADLYGKTSYYYIPNVEVLKKSGNTSSYNITDPEILNSINKLTNTALFYDKAKSHHNGVVNVVSLFSETKNTMVASNLPTIDTTGVFDIEIIDAVTSSGIGVNPNNSGNNGVFTYVNTNGTVVLTTLVPLTENASIVTFRVKGEGTLTVDGNVITIANGVYTIQAKEGQFTFSLISAGGQGNFIVTFSPGTAAGVTVTKL